MSNYTASKRSSHIKLSPQIFLPKQFKILIFLPKASHVFIITVILTSAYFWNVMLWWHTSVFFYLCIKTAIQFYSGEQNILKFSPDSSPTFIHCFPPSQLFKMPYFSWGLPLPPFTIMHHKCIQNTRIKLRRVMAVTYITLFFLISFRAFLIYAPYPQRKHVYTHRQRVRSDILIIPISH